MEDQFVARAVAQAREPDAVERLAAGLGSGPFALVVLFLSPDADLAELFITAEVSRAPVDTVSVAPTTHHKCGRCWRHLPEVTTDGELCSRCEQVVSAMDAAE